MTVDVHLAARHGAAAPSRTGTPELLLLIGIGFALGTQFLQIVLSAGAEQQGGNQLVSALFLAVYVVVGWMALRRSSAVLATLASSALLVGVMVFPLVSVAWSADRSLTFQRGVAELGSTLFGVYVVSRLQLRQLLLYLAIVYALAALVSLFVCVAVPSIGLMKTETWAGTWRGLYPHKNGLGAAMALGSLILIHGLVLAKGTLRAFLLVGLMAALLLLIQSHSTTALVTFAFVLAATFWGRIVQQWPTPMTALTVTGVGMLLVLGIQMLATVGLDGLFALLGKSADISGRIPLWQLAIVNVRERFWLGHGYEAFWILGTPNYDFIIQQLHYTPFYSHNGIIETMLNGGVVAIGLVGLALLACLWRGFFFMVRERDLAGTFPLVFYLFFIVSNVSESRIFTRNDLIWALFIALGMMLARRVRVRWVPRETRP